MQVQTLSSLLRFKNAMTKWVVNEPLLYLMIKTTFSTKQRTPYINYNL